MYNPSSGKTLPVFVADHGTSIQSLYPIASSYRKLTLSIDRRADSGKWCFWIYSEERTPGTENPELSIMFDANEEARNRFVAAQEKNNGTWLLFLVSTDITKLTIAGDGTVTKCEQFSRNEVNL